MAVLIDGAFGNAASRPLRVGDEVEYIGVVNDEFDLEKQGVVCEALDGGDVLVKWSILGEENMVWEPRSFLVPRDGQSAYEGEFDSFSENASL